jgi:adenosylcobinamide-GDP ribazoletransferase
VVAAALAVSAGLLLTGAFHEDGLADTADALGGASDREKLFLILRDSRIGSFGAAALCMVLLLRVALLSGLGALAPVALVLTQALARLPPVWMMALLPSASPEGAKTSAVARAGVPQALVASGWIVLLFAAASWVLDWTVLAALVAVATLTAAACAARFMRRAGGLTGDFLGATEQVLECSLLLTLAVWRADGAR